MSESGQSSQTNLSSQDPRTDPSDLASDLPTIFQFSTTFEVLLEVYHVTSKVKQPYGFACSLKLYRSIVFDWDWERIYPRLHSLRNYIWKILAYWFNLMLLFKFSIIARHLSMNNYVYCSITYMLLLGKNCQSKHKVKLLHCSMAS